MGGEHSRNLIIPRDSLREIAEARLHEAERLFREGHYVGAMFLGGSSLECYLKLAACFTLKLDGLPSVFKTHNLRALILYSGFDSDLRQNAALKNAFDEIVEEWGDDGRKELLYGRPANFDRLRADRFLSNLRDPKQGVISWLKNRLF